MPEMFKVEQSGTGRRRGFFFAFGFLLAIALVGLLAYQWWNREKSGPQSVVLPNIQQYVQVCANCWTEPIPDIWTGGKSVRFNYSQDTLGGLVLLGVERVNFFGDPDTFLPDHEWWDRFQEFLRFPPKPVGPQVPKGAKST